MSKLKRLALQAGLIGSESSDHEGLADFDWRYFAELVSANTCRRCGKVHDADPVDPVKISNDAAAAIAREIDMQVIMQVGKWMDEDKGYGIGTQEAYDEFVKKRNQ